MTAPVPGEWEEVAAQFGVDLAQVRRDHLISHVLAAFSKHLEDDEVLFFGGTALARTHLIDGRLSEDIDLIAHTNRSQVGTRIEMALETALRRSHGRPTWAPALTETRNSQPALLQVPDGTSIQVQLLSGTGYPDWPTEILDLHQRYTDAPPARLRVLTAEAFVASKVSAWLDRRAARDLYDLAALAQHGHITPAAVHCLSRHGARSTPPSVRVLGGPPSEAAWHQALAHQTRLNLSADEAMNAFKKAWSAAVRMVEPD
jgi:predicted nucleotidyltransferase component of viral defense system